MEQVINQKIKIKKYYFHLDINIDFSNKSYFQKKYFIFGNKFFKI